MVNISDIKYCEVSNILFIHETTLRNNMIESMRDFFRTANSENMYKLISNNVSIDDDDAHLLYANDISTALKMNSKDFANNSIVTEIYILEYEDLLKIKPICTIIIGLDGHLRIPVLFNYNYNIPTKEFIQSFVENMRNNKMEVSNG